jgi:hypothetical protein
MADKEKEWDEGDCERAAYVLSRDIAERRREEKESLYAI